MKLVFSFSSTSYKPPELSGVFLILFCFFQLYKFSHYMNIPEFIQPSFFLSTGFIYYPPITNNSPSSILAHVHPRPNIYDSADFLRPTYTPHSPNWLFDPGKVKWPPLLHIFIIDSRNILWDLGWVSITPAIKELMSNVVTFVKSSQRKSSEYTCGWVIWGACRQENWMENSSLFLTFIHDYSEDSSFIELLNRCCLWLSKGLCFPWACS